MKLGYVILYVPDVVKAAEFYERAFGLTRKFVHESGYAEMLTGDTALGFVAETLRDANGVDAQNNRPNTIAAGIEIAFITTDVQAAYDQAISAGAVAYKAPSQKPWGQTVAYVRDLNGCLVELCTPIV